MDLFRYVLLVIFCAFQSCECGLFNWMFGSKNELQTDTQKSIDTLNPAAIMASIPFELQTTDEKFLSQALEFTDIKLSDLDKCHHKVIIGLRKACAHLSEEEISKVSVNLLNCQSAVEGRPIYPCTSEMSLKDCTKDMSQDTWNAYHIVSNRARAVCYGSRQLQFRAKTEIAVNKLVSTAEQQLMAMDALKQGQDKLGRATEDTLESISSGHRNLMLQQDMLKNAQHNIQWYVASNLRQLTREKALIAAGQKELAAMTESIKEKLDVAGQQLADQQDDRKKNHVEILGDLAELQVKASTVWEKIENSTQKILSQHAETAEHYQKALENLQRVNHSIVYLLKLVERTRTEIDEKLDWLTHLAGGTGNQMAMVLTVTLHLGYFLLGALAMSFVSAPPITRIALLLSVPLNALNEIKTSSSLDFVVLTVVIVSSALLHWLMVLACVVWRRRDQLKNIKKYLPFSRKVSSNPGETFDHRQQSHPKPFLPNAYQAPQQDVDLDSSENANASPEANSPIKSKHVLESVMSSVRKSLHNFSNPKGITTGIAEATSGHGSFQYSSDSDSPEFVQSTKSFLNSPVLKSPIPLKREEDLKEVRRHLLASLDHCAPMSRVTRSASRNSSPLRSNSPASPRKICRGKLKSGLQCRRASLEGEKYCKLHLEQDDF